MGFFSLKQKFKKREGCDEPTTSKSSLKIDTSAQVVYGNPALSTPPSSPETLQPSDPPTFNNSIDSPLTPPPTPTMTPQFTMPAPDPQPMRPRSASAPERLPPKPHLKPHRASSFLSAPFSKSTKSNPQQQWNKSFSSSLFQTRSQRKRREKREGKLPAILSDYETPNSSDSESTNSSYASFISSVEADGICDPSSSTTYSPNNGGTSGKSVRRRTRGRKDRPNSLRLTMLQMTL